ncbi:MAG TPA: hypothetical protein VJR23_15905 [Candidatus Acidoferrales bacterium]|nr:hypothetical protein [Candidatus Acidoferrales bacterium]
MPDFSKMQPVPEGYARIDVSNEIWDIPLASLDKILAELKTIKVLARTQEEWLNHLAMLVQTKLKFRILVTADDVEFLEQCGICWSEGADTAAQMREKDIVIVTGIPADDDA